MLVAGNCEAAIKKMMMNLSNDFELTNLGGVAQYLGIEVHRDFAERFEISQLSYIEKIVNESGQTNAKISRFPIDTGYLKCESELLKSNEEYRKLIGLLLNVSTNTRPDIAASVAILSKRVEKPRVNDLNEVRRVIRYLKGTRNLKLALHSNKENKNLFAFSDANWAEDPSDRKSNSGYCVYLNGSLISWCCRKQSIVVSLSTAESEYIALAETSQEIAWLKYLAKAFNNNNNNNNSLFLISFRRKVLVGEILFRITFCPQKILKL
jgi:hypothetical protein